MMRSSYSCDSYSSSNRRGAFGTRPPAKGVSPPRFASSRYLRRRCLPYADGRIWMQSGLKKFSTARPIWKSPTRIMLFPVVQRRFPARQRKFPCSDFSNSLLLRAGNSPHIASVSAAFMELSEGKTATKLRKFPANSLLAGNSTHKAIGSSLVTPPPGLTGREAWSAPGHGTEP